MKDIEKAIDTLKKGNYTLVAINEEKELASTQRGVKPLLELLESGQSLDGFAVADKVIGKAAAFLYVLLAPKELFAGVISRPALEVLNENGIRIEYETLTEAIRNRDNTGFCPMEAAVMEAESPDEALRLIRAKLEAMKR